MILEKEKNNNCLNLEQFKYGTNCFQVHFMSFFSLWNDPKLIFV